MDNIILDLKDGTKIIIGESSNTNAPGAQGGIAGRAFTTWYKINSFDDQWKSLGLGLLSKDFIAQIQKCNNLEEFYKLIYNE